MPNIKLQSSDGKIFVTDVQIAKCSITIKTMLEGCGFGDDENAIIPLPKVNSFVLGKVLTWAEYHMDDPVPTDTKVQTDERQVRCSDDISSWDAEFLRVDQGTLFDLILAANYLDINGLLDVTCKFVANMIKGKNPQEIRKTFNMEDESELTTE